MWLAAMVYLQSSLEFNDCNKLSGQNVGSVALCVSSMESIDDGKIEGTLEREDRGQRAEGIFRRIIKLDARQVKRD